MTAAGWVIAAVFIGLFVLTIVTEVQEYRRYRR